MMRQAITKATAITAVQTATKTSSGLYSLR